MLSIDLNSPEFDAHFEELSSTFIKLSNVKQLKSNQCYFYDKTIEKEYLILSRRFQELNQKTNLIINLIKFSNSESIF